MQEVQEVLDFQQPQALLGSPLALVGLGFPQVLVDLAALAPPLAPLDLLALSDPLAPLVLSDLPVPPVSLAPLVSVAVAVQVTSSPGRLALVSAIMAPVAPVDQV